MSIENEINLKNLEKICNNIKTQVDTAEKNMDLFNNIIVESIGEGSTNSVWIGDAANEYKNKWENTTTEFKTAKTVLNNQVNNIQTIIKNVNDSN